MQGEDVLMVVAQWLPLTADTYGTAMALNALNRRFRQHTWTPRRTLTAVGGNFMGAEDRAGLTSIGPFHLDAEFMLFICKYCPRIQSLMCYIHGWSFRVNLDEIKTALSAGNMDQALISIQKSIDSEAEAIRGGSFNPAWILPLVQHTHLPDRGVPPLDPC